MPPPPKKPVKGVKKKKEDGTQEYVPPPLPMPGDDFDGIAMPVREVVKPDNQLRLTETQLKEEIAKMLTANNPAAPRNVARFNMKERTYKFEPMVEQTIVHYATDGWLLYKHGDEAKRQLELAKMEHDAGARFQAEMERAHHDRRGEGEEDGPDDSRQFRNQFNFSERAAQTVNYPLRDRDTYTEPPPTATVTGVCSQWLIYDEYIKDLERQKYEESMRTKATKKGAAGATPTPHYVQSMSTKEEADVLQLPSLGTAARILDRMANQNMFEEIAMDFKYWEDASDMFRGGEGTLLPLWKFQSDKSRRRQVTALCWNPQYLDLFVVGYGSYEFLKQSSGLVHVFSLKNASYPEFSFQTEAGVMCLDFHPEFASLLAVGCYDGTVLVFDIHMKNPKPIYQASVRTGKHNDPVWQIFWQCDQSQKALQFVSVSSDGNINNWTMNKSELTHESLMKLQKERGQVQGQRPVSAGATDEEGAGTAGALAGGCCLDFKKQAGQEHIYLVGTEEGSIHRCSKAYSSQYLSTYQAHHLAVYAVKWNHIHNHTFLSASADWSVKLWDSTQTKKPIMSFDLNDSVGDVAWAPYSATVFAAVTDEGKVHVFDVHENKLMPMCSQKVAKKAKLTKVLFNPKWPVLLVGDDKGCVTSLKLSPNLRKRCVPEKGQKETVEELETAKLDRVLAVAAKSDPENMHAQAKAAAAATSAAATAAAAAAAAAGAATPAS